MIYLPCAADGELSGGGGGSDQQKSRGSCTVDTSRTAGARIDLREATGTYRVEWYRADTGAARETASIEGGAFREVTSPWRGADVVVRLTRSLYRVRSTDIVPHRGGRADFPESTMHAYHRNLRDRVSLDADIRRTADGDIVVIHDETTGRTCDQDLVVADQTVAKLQTLDAAYQFDPGGDKNFPLRGQGITIPTLDEVFTAFTSHKQTGAIIWIDTKDDEDYPFGENQGLYDRLVELVGVHNLWEEAHIEVSTAKEAMALKGRDPRIRTAFYAAKGDVVLEALPHTCFARIGVPPAVAVKIADQIRAAGKGIHVSKVKRSSWKQVREVRPTTIGSDHYVELIDHLRSTGEMSPR